MRFIPALLCIALTIPALAQADSIVVTSGWLTTSAAESAATFSLTGDGNNTIQGRWPGAAFPCANCSTGPVSPAARFVYDTVPFVWGDPFARGSATIDGVTYPPLYFSGDLTFRGSSFLLPAITTPGESVVTFAQPFTFTGSVSGYDRLLEGPRELSPLFTTTWSGQGTARLRFLGASVEGRSIYSYLDTTYEFATPVPEPATLLLCGAGLAALLRRRQGGHQ